MKIESGYREIEFTEREANLLNEVKALFQSKPDHNGGDEFRYAFTREIMDGYCMHCGAPAPCYCICDD